MQIHNSDVYTYSSLQKGRVCVFSFSRSHMSNLQILIPWGRKRAGHDSATKQQDAAQSCLILCDPMDCSLPVSSVHGIFQAIILEWVTISFSRGSSQLRDRTQFSHIADRLLTVWAATEVNKKGTW